MTTTITKDEAYSIASSWGSYMTSGDPGAVFYSFPVGDASPVDAAHKAALLAYTEECLEIARKRVAEWDGEVDEWGENPEEDEDQLEALKAFFEGFTFERAVMPVIFRATKHGEFKGQVDAVFPSLAGTYDKSTFTVYSHVGQHGTRARSWFADKTRAATPAEYADLMRELEGIYSRDDDPDAVTLKPVLRFTKAHDLERERQVRIAAGG